MRHHPYGHHRHRHHHRHHHLRHPRARSALRAAVGVALLASLGLAGCGNVTAGGIGGTDVYMTGDAGAQPSPSSSYGGPSRAVLGESDATVPATAVVILGGLEGDLDVAASLFLRNGDGDLVPLTAAGPLSVMLDLEGSLEPRVAAAPVPAGSYDALILSFTDVTADVTGGLEIDGVPFLGIVEVDLQGPSLDVTRPLALVVEDGEVVELLVDLNADVWIPQLDILSHVVAAADFAASVAVRER